MSYLTQKFALFSHSLPRVAQSLLCSLTAFLHEPHYLTKAQKLDLYALDTCGWLKWDCPIGIGGSTITWTCLGKRLRKLSAEKLWEIELERISAQNTVFLKLPWFHPTCRSQTSVQQHVSTMIKSALQDSIEVSPSKNAKALEVWGMVWKDWNIGGNNLGFWTCWNFKKVEAQALLLALSKT